MSFQAYLATILTKTGRTPEQIHEIAQKENVLAENMKAKEFCDWLLEKFELGHGHSMALWKLFIDKGWIKTAHTTIK